MIPQERSLISEGSASHSTFADLPITLLSGSVRVWMDDRVPRIALHVRERIFNSIPYLSGSQCRKDSMGGNMVSDLISS